MHTAWDRADQVASAWADDAFVQEVVGFEWADWPLVQEAREEAATPAANLTYRTHDLTPGDGLSFTWSFRFLSAEQGEALHVMVGPEGVLLEETRAVSSSYVEWHEGGVARPAMDSVGLAEAIRDDPDRRALLQGGGNATLILEQVSRWTFWAYRLDVPGGDAETWYFDHVDGRMIGKGGLSWLPGIAEASLAMLQPNMLEDDTVTVPVHGSHARLTFAAEAHGGSLVPGVAHVVEIVLVSPEGDEHRFTLDTGLGADGVATIEVELPAPGDWTITAAMERGADHWVTVSWCSPGKTLSDTPPTACAYRS